MIGNVQNALKGLLINKDFYYIGNSKLELVDLLQHMESNWSWVFELIAMDICYDYDIHIYI